MITAKSLFLMAPVLGFFFVCWLPHPANQQEKPMFTLAAIGSLIFSGWMAWTLYSDVREAGSGEWSDYVTRAAIGSGSMCGIITALRAFF